ncbi:MAG: YdcF family protein, partial [Lysinibacillus sp.]
LMLAFLFGLIPFVLLALAVVTFFNSKILLEKEGRRPKNLFFSLIGFAALSVLFVYLYYYLSETQSLEQDLITVYIIGLFIYGMLFFSATALYAVLYNVFPAFYKPEYIIVLGSGLIGDRVPPLLASRIREGVKQYKKYGRKPLLIMSGGQGSDELVSEGAAMRKFAIEECGLKPQEVITEEKSTTTLENLQFSKQILKDRGITGGGFIVSNNYHALRAGFYVKEAGLRAIGIGSKTALFYLPNAFMREFIAITFMYKRFHLVMLGLYTLFMLLIFNGYS